jgi:lipopolysaccharide/colanic/teichoic acid biosynthesis glycosyltransferase
MAQIEHVLGMHSGANHPNPQCPKTLHLRGSTVSTRPTLKRVLDVVLASATLVFVAPLMLLVALLVSLDGARPIVGCIRVGGNGRLLRCLKFRTVVPGAERGLEDLLAYDDAAAEYWQCSRRPGRDPRETWIGHLLRVTGIDELPLLFSVLRGDLSLVDLSKRDPEEAARITHGR